MRGRTPAEIAGLTSQLVNYAAQGTGQSGSGGFPAQPAYVPPAQPMAGGVAAPDPYLAQTDPEAYQAQLDRYLDARLQQGLQGYAQPLLTQNAETARSLSKMGKYADVWRRYEPEIEGMLVGIPMAQRTQQTYDMAASVVRGNHVEDMANELAEKRMASFGGTGSERAGGAGGAPGAEAPADPLTVFFESDHPFVQNAKANGVDAKAVRAHCERMKISPEEYIANAQHGTIISSKNGWERHNG